MVPKTNEESRKISLHNFAIFKDQIMLNQHNVLYNNKLIIDQKLTPKINKNEKVIHELLPYLQNSTTHMENFVNDCSITMDYINSFKEYSISIWKNIDIMNNLKWQYNLVARELNQTHAIKCKLKSHEQIQLIQEMRNLGKSNKNWNKVMNNERAMLQKMLANDFKEKLQYGSVRNVIKKEIWKLAMKEVKELKNPMKAKDAKQILFYYRFGSTNKRKKKNYMNQIGDETLIELYEMEYSKIRNKEDDFEEGFRILKQYQIKEIFWRETNQSSTSEYRQKVWEAIHATDVERKYIVKSGNLEILQNFWQIDNRRKSLME
jgi:hypothetical protein